MSLCVQIPRLYESYKSSGQVSSFQDMIDNIFQPLFKVSKDPSSNPTLHNFLNIVTGFDCVDDESVQERARDSEVPLPQGACFQGRSTVAAVRLARWRGARS